MKRQIDPSHFDCKLHLRLLVLGKLFQVASLVVLVCLEDKDRSNRKRTDMSVQEKTHWKKGLKFQPISFTLLRGSSSSTFSSLNPLLS